MTDHQWKVGDRAKLQRQLDGSRRRVTLLHRAPTPSAIDVWNVRPDDGGRDEFWPSEFLRPLSAVDQLAEVSDG